MPKPPEIGENGAFPCKKAPEKPKFSQTCSLLSQYLKENGNFGDLSFEMTCDLKNKGKSEIPRQITKNLSGQLGPPKEVIEKRERPDLNLKSTDIPPDGDDVILTEVNIEETRKHGPPIRAKEQKNAQMTIFYAGRVLVYDDFPPEKAKEIMLMAEKILSSASEADCKPESLINLNYPSTSTWASNPIVDHLQRPSQVDGSDLPIARKISLHRFLEKRKGRITSKAPYQVNEGSSSDTEIPSNQSEESGKAWLGLFSKKD